MSERVAEYAKQSSAQSASALKGIADEAEAVGVQCETVQMTHKSPYEAILAFASDKGCDLIVMASHGQSGIVRVILGSVTEKIVAQATVPVLVYH
jgi:nucleotide-binding universal stress UspA family protein